MQYLLNIITKPEESEAYGLHWTNRQRTKWTGDPLLFVVSSICFLKPTVKPELVAVANKMTFSGKAYTFYIV